MSRGRCNGGFGEADEGLLIGPSGSGGRWTHRRQEATADGGAAERGRNNNPKPAHKGRSARATSDGTHADEARYKSTKHVDMDM